MARASISLSRFQQQRLCRRPQVDEFVGGPNGVGSKDIDGLFLDDGWTAKPHPKPAWADPGYYQCDMSQLGGQNLSCLLLLLA